MDTFGLEWWQLIPLAAVFFTLSSERFRQVLAAIFTNFRGVTYVVRGDAPGQYTRVNVSPGRDREIQQELSERLNEGPTESAGA